MPERRKSTDLDPFISSLPCAAENRQNPPGVKYWELIADNLSEAGCSWGCVSGVDSNGRTIFVADAHRDDGKRLVVRDYLRIHDSISGLDAAAWKRMASAV